LARQWTFTQVTFVAARLAAAAVALLGVKLVTTAALVPVVIGVTLVALAVGLWRLWPPALSVGTGLLLLMAALVPLGLINPFHAADAGGGASRAFIGRTIALAVGGAIACAVLAWLVSQARLAKLREQGQPPRAP
jgi:hypothetical protein